MINHRLLGIAVLLGTAVTAFSTTYMSNENEVYFWDDEIEENVCLSEILEVSCSPGSGDCFEETSIGFRQLYSKKNCKERLSEETGFRQ